MHRCMVSEPESCPARCKYFSLNFQSEPYGPGAALGCGRPEASTNFDNDVASFANDEAKAKSLVRFDEYKLPNDI